MKTRREDVPQGERIFFRICIFDLKLVFSFQQNHITRPDRLIHFQWNALIADRSFLVRIECHSLLSFPYSFPQVSGIQFLKKLSDNWIPNQVGDDIKMSTPTIPLKIHQEQPKQRKI